MNRHWEIYILLIILKCSENEIKLQNSLKYITKHFLCIEHKTYEHHNYDEKHKNQKLT